MIDWCEKNSWVAVFDILGFKEQIRQSGKELQRHLLKSKLDNLLKELEDEVRSLGKLEYVIFSDTIVIFAPDLEPRSYPFFLLQCTKFIENSITIRLPVRGAISVGKSFISHSPVMLIGPSFLEAYEYCEDQNWIGLLLSPSATLELREAELEPQRHNFISDDADIPLRKQAKTNILAYRFQNGESNHESHLLPYLEEMAHFAADKNKEKYWKTIDFIKKHYKYINR